MAPVRAIVMMALALPVVVTGFTNQSPAIRHAASAGCRRDSGRRAAAVATPPGDSELIRQSLAFLEEASGFYSPLKRDVYAPDFVFRGGVVGPLARCDYFDTMERLGVYKAFKLDHNSFAFSVDPVDPWSVRFYVRNTGKHVEPWQPWGALPPIPLKPTPGRDVVKGPVEAAMITFVPGDKEGELKIKFFTTGNVVKFGYEGYEFNTNGLGAVLGLFHAIGVGDVGNLALNGNVRAVSNIAASNFDFLKIPKTKSENAPAWWQQG